MSASGWTGAAMVKRGGARSTLAEHDRGNVRDFHRFTRLTNAFSKKLENHAAMVALYFMYYNFGRVHQTLRVTPAMEAGLADHVWAIEEMSPFSDKPEDVLVYVERLRQQAEEF